MAKGPLKFCSHNCNFEFLMAMALDTDSRHFLSTIITAEKHYRLSSLGLTLSHRGRDWSLLLAQLLLP